MFVSTVFEGIETGPGTYAGYLWRAFRDDPVVEFHIVAPRFSEEHSQLHASGQGLGSLSLYSRVQHLGLQLAKSPGLPTVVHGNSTHSMGHFVRYRGPLVVQVNDYETAGFPDSYLQILRAHGIRREVSGLWRYWHERRVLRRADLALCNSAYTASVVRDAYGLPEDTVKVLYKAVDTSAFCRPAELPPDPVPDLPRGSRLVYVGADWQRKGLDVLLEALGHLAGRLRSVTLTVIGPDPADQALKRLVESRRLGTRVRLVGRAERAVVASHLFHGDVFVLPSRREALGVAVLEAMSAGLPVVATDVGGIPELMSSGREGLLVAPGDPQQLSEALSTLLSERETRISMAEQGRRRAQEFTVERMTGRLREIYVALAKQASAARLQGS